MVSIFLEFRAAWARVVGMIILSKPTNKGVRSPSPGIRGICVAIWLHRHTQSFKSSTTICNAQAPSTKPAAQNSTSTHYQV